MTAPVLDDVLVDDASVWPALVALTGCLCEEISNAGLPTTCICSPMPGAGVAADYVSEDAGMAWVRLAGAYPSSAFPAIDQRAGCVSTLAFIVEVGVLYCAPIFADSTGAPPDLGAQFDATRTQMAAMAAIRRAIMCCLADTDDVVLGQYTPIGPDGAVVGGTWTLTLAEGVRSWPLA